jgi:hypothetical protein
VIFLTEQFSRLMKANLSNHHKFVTSAQKLYSCHQCSSETITETVVTSTLLEKAVFCVKTYSGPEARGLSKRTVA